MDTSQASNTWPGAVILLEQAVSNLETAIGKARLASFGLSQRQSGLSAKEKSVPNEALGIVACASAQVKVKESFVLCS